MNRILFAALPLLALTGCGKGKDRPQNDKEKEPNRQIKPSPKSLSEARAGFKTNLTRRESSGKPVPKPPAGVFEIVRYDAPLGKNAAYLTPDPKDGKKHPAIIWITGGDCNTIDEGCWREGPEANDQSASAYRKAGIVMMFPSLRGGNDNPGVKEGFYGEVDDVLAAADFLEKQPFVDPARVYLGGHSTGGTLALLTAECSKRFRAVFSFGPVHDVSEYGNDYKPFSNEPFRECELRAPLLWLNSIASPTFVIEGEDGNSRSLQAMAGNSGKMCVRFHEIEGGGHYNVLAPTNRLVATKILLDTGPVCSCCFSSEELQKPFPIVGAKRSDVEKLAEVLKVCDGYIVIPKGQIVDRGLETIAEFRRLRTLRLEGQRAFTHAGLAHLKEAASLKSLELDRSAVTEEGLKALAALPNLRSLGLAGDTLPAKSFLPLRGLTFLEELDLSDTGATDQTISAIQGHSSLRMLHLDKTRITDDGLAQLKNLKRLRMLSLKDTDVTGKGLAHLKELTELDYLDLVGTRLNNAALAHLKGLPKLEHLYLSRTSVGDGALAFLPEMASLASLDLQKTNVTDDGLSHLRRCRKLKSLDLKNTKVSQAAIDKLKKDLPDLLVFHDDAR